MSDAEEPPLWQPQPLTVEQDAQVRAAYRALAGSGAACYGPTRYLAAPDGGPTLRRCLETPLHGGDIWVVTLPKCGTTWMQELVWLLQHDCDFSGAQSLLMPDRWHFLELAAIHPQHLLDTIRQESSDAANRMFFQPIEARPTPWLVKTHLPLHMCPPNLLETCKVVYVARNPKDVCVSYLNHQRLFKRASAELTLNQFVDLFIDGLVPQLPFFPHVLEAWEQRHHPNLLFMFYEDMKKDLRGSIVKVAAFLGKSLTGEQLNNLEQHLHFKNMKNNRWVNLEWLVQPNWSSDDTSRHFMRRGETGDWKNHLTPEMDRKIEDWIEKELHGTDLKFVTEL